MVSAGVRLPGAHMNDDEEVWLPLPAAPELYEVSSLGRARRSAPGRRTKVGKPLKAHRNGSTGYLMIYPFVEGKLRAFSLHRQIAIAFHGAPSVGQVARHLDDDKLNNFASNLAWGTRKENAADALANGRLHGRRTKKDVRLERESMAGG